MKGLIPHAENTGGGHVPRLMDPEFEIGSEQNVPWFFILSDLPVLYAHGLFRFLPTRLREGGQDTLPPLIVYSSEVSPSGGEVVVLSAKNQISTRGDTAIIREQRFWIDLAKDAAILRWEELSDTVPTYRITVDWRQYGEPWLPTGWICTQFDISGRPGVATVPSMYYRYRVDRVELEPDVEPADFDVHYKPGMLVYRLDDRAWLRVAADGETLQLVRKQNPRRRDVAGAAATTEREGGKSSVNNLRSRLLLAVGSVLALVVFYLRSRVKASS